MIEIDLDDDINEHRACAFLLAEAIKQCADRAPDVPLDFSYYFTGFGSIRMIDQQLDDDPLPEDGPPPF